MLSQQCNKRELDLGLTFSKRQYSSRCFLIELSCENGLNFEFSNMQFRVLQLKERGMQQMLHSFDTSDV